MGQGKYGPVLDKLFLRIIRVSMPLKTPNRSVSANFSVSDLALNGIVETTQEEVRERAKILEMLNNPIYFVSASSGNADQVLTESDSPQTVEKGSNH